MLIFKVAIINSNVPLLSKLFSHCNKKKRCDMVGPGVYICVCSEDKNPSPLSWHLILVPSSNLLLIFLHLHFFMLQVSRKGKGENVQQNVQQPKRKFNVF